MKKAAGCGAAAPRMRTTLAGALMNWLIWFRKEPAMKVAKNTVTTCASQASELSAHARYPSFPGHGMQSCRSIYAGCFIHCSRSEYARCKDSTPTT